MTKQAKMLKLKEEPNQTIGVKMYRPILLQQMEEFCDKMDRYWGKTTNRQDEQLCSEGNKLIDKACGVDEYLRARGLISNNELIEWATIVSRKLHRCRWNERRPNGLTSILQQANKWVADLHRAWNEFYDNVRRSNGICRIQTPEQANDFKILEQWSKAVDTAIYDNCEQILLDYEAEQRKKNNEW